MRGPIWKIRHFDGIKGLYDGLYTDWYRYYHFQVLSGAESIHYDGFRVKLCQLGPLLNDISFTCFVKAVADAVKHEDRSMLKYVFSTHSRFRERCNSSVRMLKTSLVLIATKPIYGN